VVAPWRLFTKERAMNIQPTVVSLLPQGNLAVSNTTREPRTPSSEKASPISDAPQPPLRVRQPDRDTVEAAARSVREFVQPINSNLEFSVNDDTGQLVVRIIDRNTKEVIRQMPSEEMLALAKALDSIKGLFVKQTA
jgi:flagellar protein FlaG